MSSQADVRSIEALKEFRAALAMYAEEALGAVASVKMEARRTVYWVQHDRKSYWQEQLKRRREQVAAARAEVARRRLAKTPEHTPAYSEQKELLRHAEAGLREAESRLVLIKKWEPMLAQAVLEMHASIRRIGDLAGGDVPRAQHLLGRLVEALEAYIREPHPARPGLSAASGFGSIADAILAEEPDVGPVPVPDPDEPDWPEGADPSPPPD